MQILLSGANGFLGKHIYSQLASHSEIITLGRTGCVINCDLAKSIPSLPNVDTVVHAAGMAHFVPLTSLETQAFFEVNLNGTANLLKGLEQTRNLPNAFVFISSVAVYGLESGIMIPEESALLAKDPYGRSKIYAEELVVTWCKKNKIICTILRLPLLVGETPPGNLGAMIKGIQKGFFFNIAGGKAKKSMVLADDVAKAILDVAKIGGIYNLTDGYHPSFAELSEQISIQLGKNKPLNLPFYVANVLARLGDIFGNKVPINTNKLNKITSDLTFEDSKAREAFGWNPTPVLQGFKFYK